MRNRGIGDASSIKGHLKVAQIGFEDYTEVIKALFQAAPNDPPSRRATRYGRRGDPIPNATVSRQFEGAKIIAEDRGPVYVVWIMTTSEEDGTEEIVGIVESPWGQI